MRMFHTEQDVHPNHIFCPVVTAPSMSADYKPRVDWSKFHDVVALEQEELKSPHLAHVSKAWGALSSESFRLLEHLSLPVVSIRSMSACCDSNSLTYVAAAGHLGCCFALPAAFAKHFL